MEWPGGRFHVTTRGNEGRDIYRSDRDRENYLELISELPERFGVLLHADVLMERIKGNRREQAGVKQMARRHEWEEIVAAVARFSRRLPKEPGLRKLAGKIEAELSNIEI